MNTVTDYIAAAAPAVRPVLRELRRVMRAAAPGKVLRQAGVEGAKS